MSTEVSFSEETMQFLHCLLDLMQCDLYHSDPVSCDLAQAIIQQHREEVVQLSKFLSQASDVGSSTQSLHEVAVDMMVDEEPSVPSDSNLMTPTNSARLEMKRGSSRGLFTKPIAAVYYGLALSLYGIRHATLTLPELFVRSAPKRRELREVLRNSGKAVAGFMSIADAVESSLSKVTASKTATKAKLAHMREVSHLLGEGVKLFLAEAQKQGGTVVGHARCTVATADEDTANERRLAETVVVAAPAEVANLVDGHGMTPPVGVSQTPPVPPPVAPTQQQVSQPSPPPVLAGTASLQSRGRGMTWHLDQVYTDKPLPSTPMRFVVPGTPGSSALGTPAAAKVETKRPGRRLCQVEEASPADAREIVAALLPRNVQQLADEKTERAVGRKAPRREEEEVHHQPESIFFPEEHKGAALASGGPGPVSQVGPTKRRYLRCSECSLFHREELKGFGCPRR